MYSTSKLLHRQLFLLFCVVFLNIQFLVSATNYDHYDVDGVDENTLWVDLASPIEQLRIKRAAVDDTPTKASVEETIVAPSNSSSPKENIDNRKYITNNTQNVLTVNHTRLLGENGTGILRNITPSLQQQASEPIHPGDSYNDTVFETPDKIKAEYNITNLKQDTHEYYNSSFIGNVTYFNEHWTKITSAKAEVHNLLSNSHRRATTIKLSFEFPFYGHPLKNVTVATGGFVYTGDQVHNWLAATQYIAPLMANFDNSLTKESVVKIYDDGEKFTALWENVTLQENKNQTFTFAVTLYKNGDIKFAYKHIPIAVKLIDDAEHPVKVGISDAYLTDRIMYFLRRKTVYEYHRVTFKNHDITDNTIIELTALPTCHQFNSCDTCVNHDTNFNCTWCENIQKCSAGTDRNKQDWTLRNCEKTAVMNQSACPATPPTGSNNISSTSYNFDNHNVKTNITNVHSDITNVHPDDVVKSNIANDASAVRRSQQAAQPSNSHVGGAVAAFSIIAMLGCLAGWIVYAFKNPHTKSGQMLIKYRPSQWSWKRGEARYTAATIHM